MEQQKAQEHSRESEDWKQLRRGWCWGEPTFREQMLELIGEKQTEHHYGEEVQESSAEKAERLVRQLLKAARWTEAENRKPPQGAQDEGPYGVAIENRNDSELEMDCGQTENGPLAQCGQRGQFGAMQKS